MDEFKVGDGATIHYHSDAHAYTVIAVSASGRTIRMQRDKATIDPDFKPEFYPGGFAGHVANQWEQTYTYEPDPDGATASARLTTAGWRVGGKNGLRVTAGRHEFYDYNF